VALKYIAKEKEIAKRLETFDASDMPMKEKEMVQQLLEQGGARTALKLH
jgi:hypothetical protein